MYRFDIEGDGGCGEQDGERLTAKYCKYLSGIKEEENNSRVGDKDTNPPNICANMVFLTSLNY